jgi:hypothetical protein
VKVTQATIAVALVLYLGLWVLAFSGASALIEPLLVPPILAALVAMGVALQRFMGLPARRPHFRDPEDDAEQ